MLIISVLIKCRFGGYGISRTCDGGLGCVREILKILSFRRSPHVSAAYVFCGKATWRDALQRSEEKS